MRSDKMIKKFRLDDVRNEVTGNPNIVRQYSRAVDPRMYSDRTFGPLIDIFLDCSQCNCVKHECDPYCDGHQCGPYCEDHCGAEV